MEHPIVINSKGKCTIESPRWSFFRALVQKAKAQIMAQEDANIFAILDSIAENNDD